MSRIELPVVTEEKPKDEHISLLIIADAIKQATRNLEEQEANIKKFGEQIQQLQTMRVASIAQKNLLVELDRKIRELEAAVPAPE